jgi:hypothetical protein
MTTNLVLSPPVLDASGGNCGVIVPKRGPKPKCTPETKKRIAELLQSATLREICAAHPELPSRTTIDRASLEDPAFDLALAKSRAIHVQTLVDQCADDLQIYDEKNWKHLESKSRTVQWLAQSWMPRRYGNKTQLSNAEGDGPIELVVKHIVVQGK